MNTAGKVGCGCLVAVGLALLALVLLLTLGIVGCVAGALQQGDQDAEGYGESKPECQRPLEKKWMCGGGGADDPQVVYVPLRGVIAPPDAAEGLLGEEGADFARALRSIRAATRDARVRGICLMLDTPGGTVTEADVLVNAVARFRASRKGRFVLVLMGSACCSGGYYVAAGADYIIAHPTTVTGSIGVIMNGFNASELARKAGVRSVVVASGENKALLDPLAPVNPEHVKILRRPVEQDYERFLGIVAKGRRMPVEKVRPLADGRVLSAPDALAAGLVDALGYEEDAWEKAAELAKAKKVRIYRYAAPFSWRQLLSSPALMRCGRAIGRGALSAAAPAGGVRSECPALAP